MSYQAIHKIRIITAASLFDGHDAAINVMRRILQSKGVEIIHLGHNRSVYEIVRAAIEEDVHAIAITSYQGGHIEFFRFIRTLLNQNECAHIKIFGGGGGTILPEEIKLLEQEGITKIYSPDDGRIMGLEGMIEDLISHCDFELPYQINHELPMNLGTNLDIRKIARRITNVENRKDLEIENFISAEKLIPVLGITGNGGAGKSTVTDELIRRFLEMNSDKTIAILSVDPSKKKSGGALLGDRIRMNAINHPAVYMRSMATRDDNTALNGAMLNAINICKQEGFDLIVLETAGIGQSDISILNYSDISLYIMTPEYGAATQLEKINMLDYADLICINKIDKSGSLDALQEVKKQYQRNHEIWGKNSETDLPVIGTIASQFNDKGINELFSWLIKIINKKTGIQFLNYSNSDINNITFSSRIIPSNRVRYLAEIKEELKKYDEWVSEQSLNASTSYQLQGAIEMLQKDRQFANEELISKLFDLQKKSESKLDPHCLKLIKDWEALVKKYHSTDFEYMVRGNLIHRSFSYTSISGISIPKISLPKYSDWGDLLRWQLQENVPGAFPFTAGCYELKSEDESPTRMFAGEGCPERTNRRFHYLAANQPSIRLSTAFDSVTLYGEDPAERPDIFGKVGNSGVSIATLNDIKKLYSGFDLTDSKTSVSMTINGPAPIMLAFFLNAAIDQACEQYIDQNHKWNDVEKIIENKFKNSKQPAYNDPEYPNTLPKGNKKLGLKLLGISGDEVLPAELYNQIKADTLTKIRGTVQSDILKEDQAQNTCIFSTEFALKLMGDVQQYFIDHQIRNFYSVSISGYHIAEAGANPITQLAFTLANGFTYVEYYLSRGMHIDEFAPNLSFFFSNGMDLEYSVIGRVARRIWAKAIKFKYQGNERSQKLKYHIQTSGRSLHAQEIDFNDIRTTLQALYAIYDNCNSLHTNAYDEAITTPSEESVRRALAIQLIINKELGTTKNQNPLQGSFLIEEMTELVEQAVLLEFDRINERGGVLGAMERMYQRNKIQEESLHYETLKHSGELPIVGVNFFQNHNKNSVIPNTVIRSSVEERNQQIVNLSHFQKQNELKSAEALNRLKLAAISNENLFEVLMESVKYCSIGQITHCLYRIGGQYRRNM